MKKLKILLLLFLLIQVLSSNQVNASSAPRSDLKLIKYDKELNHQIRRNLIYPLQKAYFTATYDLTINKNGELKDVSLNSVYRYPKTTDKELELFLDSAQTAIKNSFPYEPLPINTTGDHHDQITFFVKPAKNQIIYIDKTVINNDKNLQIKQKTIAKHLEKQWLPIYYSKKIYTVVSFNVGKEGNLENIKILKQSKYSTYDKSVLDFLQKTKLSPQSEPVFMTLDICSFGPDAKDNTKMITFTALSLGLMGNYYMDYYGLNSL